MEEHEERFEDWYRNKGQQILMLQRTSKKIFNLPLSYIASSVKNDIRKILKEIPNYLILYPYMILSYVVLACTFVAVIVGILILCYNICKNIIIFLILLIVILPIAIRIARIAAAIMFAIWIFIVILATMVFAAYYFLVNYPPPFLR